MRIATSELKELRVKFVYHVRARTRASKLVFASMIIFLLVGSSVASLAATTQTSFQMSSQGTISYQQAITWLHTDGTSIKNNYGQTVHLTGVCIPPFLIRDFILYPSATKNIEYQVNLLKEYKVPSVRVFLMRGWWTGLGDSLGSHIEPEVYKATIDELVTSLENAGIYCWLSFEGGDEAAFNNDPTPWITVLEEWATRYKDHLNMFAIEPKNEPYTSLWPNYYTHILQAAQAIHAINPNLLVLVDSGAHGWMKFPYFKYNPLPEPNIVYVYHHYYRWQYTSDFWQSYYDGNFELAKQQLEDFMFSDNHPWSMLSAGYPVMDGEFGIRGKDIGEAESPDLEPNWRIFLQDYLDLMKKHGVSWNYYCWWTSPENYGTFDGSWITPSPAGEIVFAKFESIPTSP